MKLTMIKSLHKRFWLISLIWATCHILGVLSVETITELPKDFLQRLRDANASEIKDIINNTRRIMNGKQSTPRPYMVYLKLPNSNNKAREYKQWLCGGVIIHDEYILTSAACIEDVKHFYVVAGTYKFDFADDKFNNPCIKNGAKKAIWKCIPKNYVFDGHENDNIRWMNNDIAVVKVEEEFNFERKVKGCDYIPRPVCYNNVSKDLERDGKEGIVAGWGSTEKYRDWVNTRRADEQQNLLESQVTILEKNMCKRRWGKRYHNIIDNYMICTKDIAQDLSEICSEKYVDCTDVLDESEEDMRRKAPEELGVHSANHGYSIDPPGRRQMNHLVGGGFCENDHGGPLIMGDGVSAVVVGIISACLVKEKTNKCYGPFLYTSVFKNRALINCAIYKDINTCDKLFRSGFTHEEVEMSWSDHPDGSSKGDIKAGRRSLLETKKNDDVNATVAITASTANGTIPVIGTSPISSKAPVTPTVLNKADRPLQREGLILRAHDQKQEN